MGNHHLAPHLNKMIDLSRDRGASYEVDPATTHVFMIRQDIAGNKERRLLGLGVIAALQTLEREKMLMETGAAAIAERDWKAIDFERQKSAAAQG